MADREKVIKGLEGIYRCISPANHTCGDCPYQDNHVECERRVINDAIALLKEQESKPVELHTNAYGTKFYFCPKCKRELFHTRNLNFCEKCGQAVKWE